MKQNWKSTALIGFFAGAASVTTAFANGTYDIDLNSAQSSDAEIKAIYSANRGDNGGGDQSLQFGDILTGDYYDNVLIGGLGIDVLFGGDGDDIIIGGTEDFNALNRDRAFGEKGDDSFLWAPGDGNDFFDGGEGVDVLFMTLIGENKNANGEPVDTPVFAVSPPGKPGTGDFDGIALNEYGVPIIDVANGPGFCKIVEKDNENEQALSDLGLDHLVRFVLRGPNQKFEDQLATDPTVDPDTLDTGLRISVHLKNVEFLVCGSKAGDRVQVFDLTKVPAEEVDASQLPLATNKLF